MIKTIMWITAHTLFAYFIVACIVGGSVDAQWVITQFKFSGHTHNVFEVPKWKNDILDDLGYDRNLKLFLFALNNIECWLEDWSCINSADSWPFQINQIHKEDYKYSKYLIDYPYKQEYKYNRWQMFELDYDYAKKELYKFQAKWTVDRISRLKYLCDYTKLENRIECYWVLHNWNNKLAQDWKPWKYHYWKKLMIVFNKLNNYYK